jgi:hypothetical protein
MKPSTHLTQLTAPGADPEAVLFGRLVALVLSWPCKRCGQTGICHCYQEQPPEDSATKAETQVRPASIEERPIQP